MCHVDLGPDSREFLRLLYILAHRRTVKYFADMGDDEPGTDAFTLNISGNIRLPLASATPSLSHVRPHVRA